MRFKFPPTSSTATLGCVLLYAACALLFFATIAKPAQAGVPVLPLGLHGPAANGALHQVSQERHFEPVVLQRLSATDRDLSGHFRCLFGAGLPDHRGFDRCQTDWMR